MTYSILHRVQGALFHHVLYGIRIREILSQLSLFHFVLDELSKVKLSLMMADQQHKHKNRMQLADKAYLIFKEAGSKQLSIDEFCKQFRYRFNEADIDIRSVKKLSFIHASPYDDDTIYIFLDLGLLLCFEERLRLMQIYTNCRRYLSKWGFV